MTAILRGHHLTRRLDRCSPDELRILDRVLLRLERRRERAGSLDLAKRPDVFAELNEGLIDAVIACTILTIRAEDTAHTKSREELTELAHWEKNDQRTVVADCHQIALADIAEHAPRPQLDESDWDMSEFGSGEGA